MVTVGVRREVRDARRRPWSAAEVLTVIPTPRPWSVRYVTHAAVHRAVLSRAKAAVHREVRATCRRLVRHRWLRPY